MVDQVQSIGQCGRICLPIEITEIKQIANNGGYHSWNHCRERTKGEAAKNCSINGKLHHGIQDSITYVNDLQVLVQ